MGERKTTWILTRQELIDLINFRAMEMGEEEIPKDCTIFSLDTMGVGKTLLKEGIEISWTKK